MTLKPLLKWVGGKTQILTEVVSRFPPVIENYYEPFLGGGSVLLSVLSLIEEGRIKIHGKIYANDINKNLIGFYRNIQTSPEAVLYELKKITDEFQTIQDMEVIRKPVSQTDARTSKESYYYWIRFRYNTLTVEEKTTPLASAMFLFLNKTGFRGMYREGPNGFNVPYGNYKNPSFVEEKHLMQVSHSIQKVQFTSCSFTDACETILPGDYVYLDPPYAPETSTSFVSYTADGFKLDMHQQLLHLCHTMHRKGIHFLLSNADVSFIRNAFPPPMYKTSILTCRRKINSKNPGSTTNEVLILNE